MENNSGNGSLTIVNEEISKKFNWGAFLLSWIWGIGNKTWITFVIIPASFIPFIGCLVMLGLQIWFGIKGNEWAWQNKKFESVEQFHENQKKWAIAGVIVAIIGILWSIFMLYMCFTLHQFYTPGINNG